MRREYFEILWDQCNEGCLGPPFQPVSEEVWQDLIDKQIVGDCEIPDKVYSFDPYNEYGDIGRRCFYWDRNSWEISGFTPKELDRLHSKGKISIYSIDVEKLGRLIAEQWEIKSVFWELDLRNSIGGTYVIGWKDRGTAVVITDFGSKSGPLVDFLEEIRESIRYDKRDMFEECALVEPGQEDEDLSNQYKSWTTKYLYVINIGNSCSRTAEMQKDLDILGITCLGTADFLTDDGKPKWDAQVKQGPIFSYSDDKKEFECDGEPLILKPTERIILKVLRQNGDKITEKEELYKAIWSSKRNRRTRRSAKRIGMPQWPESTLYAHISSLKKKLKETGKLSIECNRGKGYRLILYRER